MFNFSVVGNILTALKKTFHISFYVHYVNDVWIICSGVFLFNMYYNIEFDKKKKQELLTCQVSVYLWQAAEAANDIDSAVLVFQLYEVLVCCLLEGKMQ